MSDPTLEEESLISQDDIDKLLDASSLEEAEEKLDAPQEEADSDMDEIGELSQDDIDNLLTGSDDEPPESEVNDAGELSQDDIDSLMGNDPEEEAGELSQDDIDGLLGGGDDDDGDDEDMELISQDDIDSLMNASGDDLEDDDDDEDDDEDEDDELISMDDVQDMIGDDTPLGESGPDDAVPGQTAAEPVEEDAADEPEATPVEDSPGPEPDEGTQDPYDEVINDAESVAVIDCLITQDVMDDLIRNAPEPQAAVADPATDPAPPPAEPEPAPLAEDDLESPIDLDEGPVDRDASVEDLDSLLDDAEDDLGLNLEGEIDGDVTQEDIDALLQGSDDDGGDFLDEDDDILISQDDIDTLLMAADQEDEDVLGDLLGDVVDDGMEDFDEQEIVSDNAEEEDDIDQVVLEGDEEDTDTEPGETSERAKKIKVLLKSKLVLAVASVLLVLGISIPAAYFIFFSGKPVALPEKESVPVAAQDVTRDVEVASVSIEDETPVPAVKQSGTIILADFIILASDLTEDMTYVYADISIDYSDQRAYHEINNNLSFYRDLIYESIQTSLVSEKRNEVTESDLLWGVETSLKKVLPPHFIEKISFKTFRTS